MVVRRVGLGEAPDHLEPVGVGGAGDERVQPVLRGERVRQRRGCAP